MICHLQGWIKGVNSNSLNENYDPGKDAAGLSSNHQVAKDVFGYSLHYYSGDYSPINGNSSFIGNQTSSDLVSNSHNLYNGNIGRMVTTITDPNTRDVLPLGNAYKYDQLNRLKQARSFDNYDSGTNSWGSSGSEKYYNAFTYDANGNIESQIRKDESNATIDSLTYNYHDISGKRVRNRLYSVNDAVGSGTFSDDLDDMGTFFSADSIINQSNNYVYDAEGRLVKDLQEEIDTIIWRVDGKVKYILRPSTSSKKSVSFDYDAMGHRIAKHIYTYNSGYVLNRSTYYLLDAQGNTMSTYEYVVDSETESVAFAQTEKHIYGSSRLGVHGQTVPMLGSQNATYSMDYVSHRIGERLYELSNHLGNVLSIVSDKLLPVQYRESQRVIDFNDNFDVNNNFMGWNHYPNPGDTCFVSGGALNWYSAVGLGIDKIVTVNIDPYSYWGGTWTNQYYLDYDVNAVSSGGTVSLTVDDGAYALSNTGYSTTPEHKSLFLTLGTNYIYLSVNEGYDYYHFNESFTIDNIVLSHDAPPTYYFVADIRHSQDYSPFGVTLHGRDLSLSTTGNKPYRYGFNDMEKDDEISGEGNSYTAEFWQYDSRLGRRWNPDPVMKYHESPYACFANDPIWIIDKNGADSALYDETKGFLVSRGKTEADDKTAVWTVDTQAKDYDIANPWKTAKKLTYTVGKDQKTDVGKTNLRSDHPLAGEGWNYGDQVYEEDLIDMTKEFNDLVVKWTPYFKKVAASYDDNIRRMIDCWVCSTASVAEAQDAKTFKFIMMVGPDMNFDLKSRTRGNINEIPTYAAVVIGQFSMYNGRLMHNDDYGNAAYAAWGKAFGFNLATLQMAGDLDQSVFSIFGKTNGGDTPRDQYWIKYGYWRL